MAEGPWGPPEWRPKPGHLALLALILLGVLVAAQVMLNGSGCTTRCEAAHVLLVVAISAAAVMFVVSMIFVVG